MDDLGPFITKFLSDLYALPEEKMRLDLLGRTLVTLGSETGARLLDNIYSRGQEDTGAKRVKTLLIDPDGLKAAIGPEKHKEILLAAVRLGFKKISRLFTDLPPHKSGPSGYDKEEEIKMEYLTLGERRASSKTLSKNILDRLLSDPDPIVISNLLNNPRITEKDILKIASKRPNSSAILKLIALHKVWSKRYEVIKAIIKNPYTQPRVSIALLEFLLMQDMDEIAEDKGLHPQLRLSAKEMMDEKKGGKA